jgi:hypothetical protein
LASCTSVSFLSVPLIQSLSLRISFSVRRECFAALQLLLHSNIVLEIISSQKLHLCSRGSLLIYSALCSGKYSTQHNTPSNYSYWLPGLAQSWPYSPLVRSRFLPWLTGSYISNRFHARGLLIALMMEAARTSEMLVNFYQTTRRYNQEDSHLHRTGSLTCVFMLSCWSNKTERNVPYLRHCAKLNNNIFRKSLGHFDANEYDTRKPVSNEDIASLLCV